MNDCRNKRLRFVVVIIGLITVGPLVLCAHATDGGANQSVRVDQAESLPAVSDEADAEILQIPEGGENAALETIEDQLIEGREDSEERDGTRGRSSFTALGGKIWLALGLVLMLIVGAGLIIRKAYPGGRMFSSLKGVEVLGRLYLSPKQVLILTKIDQTLLLLGMTEHHINSLLTISDPDQVSRILTKVEQGQAGSVTSSFLHLFGQERKGFDSVESLESPEGDSRECSQENANKGVLELKSEINSLINKVNRLKGFGGRD